jgi:predicted protein tyrosine phosphatase
MRVGLAKASMDTRVAAEMLEWSALSRQSSKSIEEQHRLRRFSTALRKLKQVHRDVPNVGSVFTVAAVNTKLVVMTLVWCAD